MNKPLRILGGTPAFIEYQPISRPTLPPFSAVSEKFAAVYLSGMLTRGPYLQEFEEASAEFLGVKHVVAVSSNTAGQMLVMSALGLKGEVILPSFSFCATSHVLKWCGLKPRWVEVNEKSCNIDPAAVRAAITSETSAILGVHLFGNSCELDELEAIAKEKNVRLIFDSAQAFGSEYKGRKIGGFGDAEVFSCSPTKLITCGEGGLVATNNDSIAERIRLGRNYGIETGNECALTGLSARLTEFQAITGLASLEALPENLKSRRARAEQYREFLGRLSGISLPVENPDGVSNYSYCSVMVDGDAFGLTRDELVQVLEGENIGVRRYFSPPLHRLRLREGEPAVELPITDKISHQSISFPLYSHSTEEQVSRVCATVQAIQANAAPIKKLLALTASS